MLLTQLATRSLSLSALGMAALLGGMEYEADTDGSMYKIKLSDHLTCEVIEFVID